jgi:transporter family protein
MELWILFSVLAALTWAIVNIIDKYVLTKWVRAPIVPVIINGIIGLLAGLFILLFQGLSTLSYLNIALVFVAGIFYILSLFFYFRAAKIEEISRVIPLYQLSPLFVLIFAALFLGRFSPR